MSDSNAKVSVSFPLCSVLFIVFLVLKLTGNIDWSWWWVTAPLWIPFCIAFGLVVLVLFIAGLAACGAINNRKR